MKFKNDLAWVLAMDELQGDIPDPSPFRSEECEEPKASATCGTARGDAPAVAMHTAPSLPTIRTSARGSNRSGAGGSMSC